MKLKKFLLILPLFSLFFINFSFAGVCSDHSIPQYNNNFKWQFINGYSNNFNSEYNYGGLPLGNVETLYNNTTKKIIAVNRNTLFWWQENGKPYIYRNDSTQGEPDRIITCNKNTDIGYHSITGCNCMDMSGNVQNIIDFMGTIKSGDYIGVAKLGAGFFVCFSSEELNYSMCFGESTENYSDTHLSNSKNYSNIDFSNLNENLLFDSPGLLFTGDSGSDSEYPPVEYISTYGQFFINKGDAYQLYETLGYSEGICYGNFATGSIVESGSYNYFLSYLLPTECDDSEDYCGGSFFDFYNIQSGLSLQSYFNRYYYTSKSIFEHPDNISLLSSLVGYPKGIWYIMYKIFYFYDDLYIPFSSADYLAYCDMAVNGFDPSDTFDVPHSLAFDNFIQEVMEAYLLGDNYNGSGDDVGTGQVSVSLRSGTGSLSDWFSRLKYAVLNNRFIFSYSEGFLPSYIGLAFILMLLYYGFKR